MMVAGLPGSGKSALARLLALYCQAEHLNTDLVRNEAGMRGKYDAVSVKQVYERMFERAKEVLNAGRHVIVDATFADEERRADFERVVSGAQVFRILVVCDEQAALERVRQSRPDSEAGEEVYLQMKKTYAPFRQDVMQVDSTDVPAQDQVDVVLAKLLESGFPASDVRTSADVMEKDLHGVTNRYDTHISTVLIAPPFAYKLKKHERFNFLDFSRLADRRHFCEEEVRLNSRLAPDMYLGVVPVEKDEVLLDYAVKMKALDPALQMHVMLENGQVTEAHVEAIARRVGVFHAGAEKIYVGQDAGALLKRFMNIRDALDAVKKDLPAPMVRRATKAMEGVEVYLGQEKKFIENRRQAGWVRDVHGDLHARNIFLYEDPVVFDCIEFNPDFRRIDLLNEVAFFCMDMEAADKPELASAFMKAYLPCVPGVDEGADSLFIYFKAYRANVRAKVNFLQAAQGKPGSEAALKAGVHYLGWMCTYMEQISNRSRMLS